MLSHCESGGHAGGGLYSAILSRPGIASAAARQPVNKQLCAAAATPGQRPPSTAQLPPPLLPTPGAMAQAPFVCFGVFKTLCYTLNHTGPLTGTCYCTCVLHCTLHPAPCVFYLHLYLAPCDFLLHLYLALVPARPAYRTCTTLPQ